MITCHWRLPLKLHACTVKWLSEMWKKEKGMLLFIRVYMYLKLISDSLSLCSCQQTRSHWKAYIAWWRWSGNHVPRMQRLRYRRRNRGWRFWRSARFVSASQIKVKLEPFTFIRHYTYFPLVAGTTRINPQTVFYAYMHKKLSLGLS